MNRATIIAGLLLLTASCAASQEPASQEQSCLDAGWAKDTAGYDRCVYVHKAALACGGDRSCLFDLVDRYDAQQAAIAQQRTMIDEAERSVFRFQHARDPETGRLLHPHFETVRARMSELVTQGLDMDSAYWVAVEEYGLSP